MLGYAFLAQSPIPQRAFFHVAVSAARVVTSVLPLSTFTVEIENVFKREESEVTPKNVPQERCHVEFSH